MSADLTMWQLVLQSQLIHPDWSPDTHFAWLFQEGRDAIVELDGDPLEVIARWLAENVAAGRVPDPSADHQAHLPAAQRSPDWGGD